MSVQERRGSELRKEIRDAPFEAMHLFEVHLRIVSQVRFQEGNNLSDETLA